ncbi:hypothetical protein AM1_H0050 (plasmid) [Acaryochloris marina MBIC11017]|uniref:Uncharacterized protein n=1 Tax=Acaryochloris marina (strain MBIC 11017) TaxID=329726 RepID=A8ZQW4_ACAM1|nr:hypothetical protein AM1_H0050 [Acaryochloris marina MBIC11017]
MAIVAVVAAIMPSSVTLIGFSMMDYPAIDKKMNVDRY